MKLETILKVFGGIVAGSILTYLAIDSKEKNKKIKGLENLLEEKDGLISNQQKFIDEILNRIKQIKEPSFKSDDLSHVGQAKVLTEAVHAYGFGLFRSSAIMSGSVVESILQEQFNQEMNFYKLIEKAKKDKLITEKDAFALSTVRKERNNVHDLTHEISERDALITVNISIGLIEKLVDVKKKKQLMIA